LEFFLEADKCFVNCAPDILNLVDNYGLLCLDVAWTYFKLENLEYLKDARWRLEKATECLKKSHGEHQERLVQLKGGACPEFVVYVRLYLLQAIVLVFTKDYDSAKTFLSKAEKHLKDMTVTDEEMLPLLQMGFTTSECRIGLRATSKNPSAATQYILNKREIKKKQKEEEKRRMAERRELTKWGKTKSGMWVENLLLTSITGMGFDKALVAEALKQTDNNQEQALKLLLETPELLIIKDENSKYEPIQADIDKVVSMGFTESQARSTLLFTKGNVEHTVELLISGQGKDDPPPTIQEVDLEAEKKRKNKRIYLKLKKRLSKK